MQPIQGPGDARVYALPLRATPTFVANACLVVDDDYTALVDTGAGTPSSDADLAAGFEAVRALGEAVALARLDRIVVTHGHLDHHGGLTFLRRHANAPVVIHALDRAVIEDPRGHHATTEHALRRFFAEAGLSPTEVQAALAEYHDPDELTAPVAAAEALAEGDLVDGRFGVLHTPGHCAGQVCLRFGDLLFSADHVLPDAFPHVAPERSQAYTGLGHFLAALDKVEALEGVRLALPGHGQPMADMSARIAQLRVSDRRKRERVLAACDRPQTLREITEAVYPRVRGYHAYLALEKVGAYVEALTADGSLCPDGAPVPRYQAALMARA